MADLGLYNYIQNAQSSGKTKEEITEQLVRGGNSPDAIEDAFAAVETQSSPAAPAQAPLSVSSRAETEPRHRWSQERPTIITVGCIIWSFILIVDLVRVVLIGWVILMAEFSSGQTASPLALALGFLFPLVMIGFDFVIVYGYWMMRRWAVYAYTFLFVCTFVLSIGVIAQNPLALISIANLVAIGMIAAGFHYIEEMS